MRWRTTLPGTPSTSEPSGIILALGHERARADEAVLPDDGAVQDDRADADEGVLADGAAVQHHQVADAHVPLEHDRDAAVGVDHRAVLHVHVLAERDDVVVAAEGARPTRRWRPSS